MAKESSEIVVRTDAEDRVVEADEPFAGFHRQAGGALPGDLLFPALLDLVRKARVYGLRLSRPFRAESRENRVTAWVDIAPDGDGSLARITDWQVTPTSGTAQSAAPAKLALWRHLAGLTAHLGPSQELLAVDHEAEDLADLASRMGEGIGTLWSTHIAPTKAEPAAPLHWRLVDGATIEVPGSERRWTVHLHPIGTPQPGSDGFELYLVSRDNIVSQASDIKTEKKSKPGIGRQIAPVLRRPVSRIIANAETIRAQLSGPLADEYSNYAADIATAGEHLLSLIDDLTTLEVIEDAGFAPAPDRIDLADVARRAAGILGVRAKEQTIALDAPASGDSTPAIGEFRRVLQILLNLVGNAIRYSPEGGSVWIRTEKTDDRAFITVADQGAGLNLEEQDRAFAKFERLGRSGDGGSGLGLYISRRLAEAMGGELTVESAKGQGARFTLSLPTFEERRKEPRP